MAVSISILNSSETSIGNGFWFLCNLCFKYFIRKKFSFPHNTDRYLSSGLFKYLKSSISIKKKSIIFQNFRNLYFEVLCSVNLVCFRCCHGYYYYQLRRAKSLTIGLIVGLLSPLNCKFLCPIRKEDMKVYDNLTIYQ